MSYFLLEFRRGNLRNLSLSRGRSGHSISSLTSSLYGSSALTSPTTPSPNIHNPNPNQRNPEHNTTIKFVFPATSMDCQNNSASTSMNPINNQKVDQSVSDEESRYSSEQSQQSDSVSKFTPSTSQFADSTSSNTLKTTSQSFPPSPPPSENFSSLPNFIYNYHFPPPPQPPKHLIIREPPPQEGAREKVLQKVSKRFTIKIQANNI